jgi:hypothetical protein
LAPWKSAMAVKSSRPSRSAGRPDRAGKVRASAPEHRCA